jgi:hypothetical protein
VWCTLLAWIRSDMALYLDASIMHVSTFMTDIIVIYLNCFYSSDAGDSRDPWYSTSWLRVGQRGAETPRYLCVCSHGQRQNPGLCCTTRTGIMVSSFQTCATDVLTLYFLVKNFWGRLHVVDAKLYTFVTLRKRKQFTLFFSKVPVYINCNS